MKAVFLRKSLPVLAAALVTLAPHAAHAAAVASVTGSGTITPGLPDEPACDYQAVTFDGTATVEGDDAGTYNVTFGGNSDICETLTSGHGSGTLSGGVSGNVTYTRNGNAVTLSGSGSVNGHPHSIAAATCEFVPTTTSPVATYDLRCQVVLT